MLTIITHSKEETQELGAKLARDLKDANVVCLSGELGSGKTTFTQGFLEALRARGPYTSPTFLIMKEYKINDSRLENVYHIDAYRVDEKDIAQLGWEEIVADKKNVVIVEWAERIENIIPKNAIRIKFEWVSENERKIFFEN